MSNTIIDLQIVSVDARIAALEAVIGYYRAKLELLESRIRNLESLATLSVPPAGYGDVGAINDDGDDGVVVDFTSEYGDAPQ